MGKFCEWEQIYVWLSPCKWKHQKYREKYQFAMLRTPFAALTRCPRPAFGWPEVWASLDKNGPFQASLRDPKSPAMLLVSWLQTKAG